MASSGRRGNVTRRPVKKPSKVPEAVTRREDGRIICGARTRTRPGGRCQSTQVMPNGRCRMHGGSTPIGILNPAIRTGLYSTALPDNLLERFEAARADPDLLNHQRDAALITAMIDSKLSALRDAQENPDLTNLTEMIENIATNWRTWDWTRMEPEIERLRDAITARVQEEQTLREVRELIKERGSVVSLENRRAAELRANIPVDQVMLLMGGLIAVVRRYVMPLEGGQEAMKAIATDFRVVSSIREQ